MKSHSISIYIIPCIFFSILFKPCQSQIDIQDSIALVNFYTNTNGPNWTNNTNWLIGPVNTWYGLMTLNGHVRKIELINNNLTGTIIQSLCELQHVNHVDLSGNNLTGQIPECAGNITQLGELILSHNHLTSPIPLSLGDSSSNHLTGLIIEYNEFTGNFPDTLMKRYNFHSININNNKFTSFPPKTNGGGFSGLDLRNNCLTFKDIIFYKVNSFVPYYLYYPQDSILQNIDTTILLGSDLTMDSWVDTCNQNRYSWYKNGNFLNWNSVNSTWSLNNVQFADSGNYTCKVSNAVCNGLYLDRRIIHVHVTDTITSVSTPSQAKEVQIDYNLSSNHLRININLKSTSMIRCNLYDNMGRKILRLFDGTTNQQELNYYLRDTKIAKGLYFVKLEKDAQVFTKKLIVN